jgi:hypothetical protein
MFDLLLELIYLEIFIQEGEKNLAKYVWCLVLAVMMNEKKRINKISQKEGFNNTTTTATSSSSAPHNSAFLMEKHFFPCKKDLFSLRKWLKLLQNLNAMI